MENNDIVEQVNKKIESLGDALYSEIYRLRKDILELQGTEDIADQVGKKIDASDKTLYQEIANLKREVYGVKEEMAQLRRTNQMLLEELANFLKAMKQSKESSITSPNQEAEQESQTIEKSNSFHY